MSKIKNQSKLDAICNRIKSNLNNGGGVGSNVFKELSAIEADNNNQAKGILFQAYSPAVTTATDNDTVNYCVKDCNDLNVAKQEVDIQENSRNAVRSGDLNTMEYDDFEKDDVTDQVDITDHVGAVDMSASAPKDLRKNRRKNFYPRYIQDGREDQEFDDYEPMRIDLSEPEIRAEDCEEVLDLRVDLNKINSQANTSSCTDEVIDLSIRSSQFESSEDNESNMRISSDNRYVSRSIPDLISPFDEMSNHSSQTYSFARGENEMLRNQPSPCRDSGSSMKDYAMTTMDELLNIYGLKDEPDPSQMATSHVDRTGGVPSNFASTDSMGWRTNLSESAENSQNEIKPSISTRLDEHPTGKSRKFKAGYLDSGPNKLPHSNSRHGISNRMLLSQRYSELKHNLADQSKYIKRFNSFKDCGNNFCSEKGYREHFHCTVCTSRVSLRKEEMIRHFKWHKKREDSLQHGFMRYSPMDDCSKNFSVYCSHNGKHTHYHCLKDGCNKVYISTSDVQMHANYHRKDTAIIQEGFQRFRASENCAMSSCVFAGQKTTHFHCRRPGCNFTFKNKADMEKHKSYHQKDEILMRDGFKKFMKYEQCNFPDCHYSRVSNHIHCIRRGCNYVLHSTGQLYSHKRKHERHNFELSAFKELKSAEPMLPKSSKFKRSVMDVPGEKSLSKEDQEFVDLEDLVRISQLKPSDDDAKWAGSNDSGSQLAADETDESCDEEEDWDGNAGKSSRPDVVPSSYMDQRSAPTSPLPLLITNINDVPLGESLNLLKFRPGIEKRTESPSSSSSSADVIPPVSSSSSSSPASTSLCLPKHPPAVNGKKERDESWKKYLTRFTANDPCFARCELLYKDHYHCNQNRCGQLFRSKDGVREHAKLHEQQDRVTALTFMKYDADTKCNNGCRYSEKEEHYHCIWSGCSQVITAIDSVFCRLEHHKCHEFSGRKSSSLLQENGSFTDNMRRKRGRPPKFPKFSKYSVPIGLKSEMIDVEIPVPNLIGGIETEAEGFQKYEANQECPDDRCVFFKTSHYHCIRPRCFHVSDRADALVLHSRDFHNFIDIADGYEFFDRNVDCRRFSCHINRTNRHFHCIRPNCDYSFVRYATMVQHDRKHQMPDESGSFASVGARNAASAVISNINQTLIVADNNAPILSLPVGNISNDAAKNSNNVVVCHNCPPIPIFTPNDGLPILAPKPDALPPLAPILMRPLTTLADVVQASSMGQINFLAESLSHQIQLPNLTSIKLVSIAPKPATISIPTSTFGVIPQAPLTLLLQQKANTASPQMNWLAMRMKMHYGVHQNCGRPFCKLKKKDHYHCFDCNRAFSESTRLKSHIARHGITNEPNDNWMANRNGDTSATESSPGLSISKEMEIKMEDASEELPNDEIKTEITDESPATVDETVVNEVQETPIDDSGSNSGIKQPYSEVSQDLSDPLNPSTSGRTPSPAVALSNGYKKFRFDENCNQDRCAYCLSMTHYHCTRPDCGYSFCDHTRFLQHNERHQRLDGIMADEFQQFYAKSDCHHADCEYASKATHFHCLFCQFTCTDASKVIAHRKHHSKMELIAEQGFTKYTISDDCGVDGCVHRSKQTHYHCVYEHCRQTAMGPSQMTSHKAKHSG